MTGPGGLTIQEFLLAYALGDVGSTDDPDGPAAWVDDLRPDESAPARLALADARMSLRAEIERHNDRTMTVVRHGSIETISRCGICPPEELRPCTALRMLALPYARHPAYRPEWRVQPTAADRVIGQEGVAEAEALAVLHRRESDLPPPGNARRRILRQYGISFSRSDYTDEELAQRGISSETTLGPATD